MFLDFFRFVVRPALRVLLLCICSGQVVPARAVSVAAVVSVVDVVAVAAPVSVAPSAVVVRIVLVVVCLSVVSAAVAAVLLGSLFPYALPILIHRF